MWHCVLCILAGGAPLHTLATEVQAYSGEFEVHDSTAFLQVEDGLLRNISKALPSRYDGLKPSNLSEDVPSDEAAEHVVLWHYRHYSWAIFAILLLTVASLVWQYRGVICRWCISRNTEVDFRFTPEVLRKMTMVFLLSILYILLSCSLIKYNKYLMDGNFPFAINLALGQQLFGSIILLCGWFLRPECFPSLHNVLSSSFRSTVVGRTFPVSLCFCGQLILSNYAYIFASVAFLQMMKESNMVLVYAMSLIASIEAFHGGRAKVLLCLLLVTILSVKGEVSFSFSGFVLQGTSQVLESLKIVLQAILLASAGTLRLDSMSFNLLVQPQTTLLLSIVLVCYMSWFDGLPMATWSDYRAWWPHLCANGLNALLLNLVAASFIARTSAVGFIIVGILKDVTLVSVDIMLFGSPTSKLQCIAFALEIVFVLCYSLMKTFALQEEGKQSQPVIDKKENVK